MSAEAIRTPARTTLPRPRLNPIVFGLICVFIFMAVIEVLVRTKILNPFLIPTPTAVISSLGRLVTDEHLARRFGLTLTLAMSACAAITLIGVPIGAVMHRLPRIRSAFEGWVAAWMAAPIVLAYPLFMVLIGRNGMTIIVMASLAGVGPVIIKTLEGLSGVRQTLIKVGRGFRLSDRQLYWKILLPSALPTIFTGIRLGAMRALLGVVGMEFLTNFGGLGQLINELAERYDIAGTFAAILFVVFVSVLFFSIVEVVEKWLAKRV